MVLQSFTNERSKSIGLEVRTVQYTLQYILVYCNTGSHVAMHNHTTTMHAHMDACSTVNRDYLDHGSDTAAIHAEEYNSQ